MLCISPIKIELNIYYYEIIIIIEMSCPFCQNPTPPGKNYCSSQCARMVLSAIKEANPELNNMSNFNRIPYDKAPYEKAPYDKAPYMKAPYMKAPYMKAPYEKAPYEKTLYHNHPHDDKPQYALPTTQPFNNKPSYQDLLKQNQDSVVNTTVTNKCMTDPCQKQTSGNDLYCSDCDMSNTKCKKCGVNDRNMPHPICTDCHKIMKDKPREKKEQPNKKDKSKYDKKKKV